MENERMKELRKRLVDSLSKYYNLNEKVVQAMNKVPRHLFVPEALQKSAYEDTPLPIGEGQTISAPHMVAIMCNLLDLKEGHKVLEIGAGSGYHAAVIAEIIGNKGEVIAVERYESLAERARRNLEKAGYTNVKVVVGDGSLGYKEYAPYDRINVTCSAPGIPPPLIEQLKKGGKMIIPIGRHYQELYLVVKKNGVEKSPKGGVMFVPLVGKYGFDQ
jgi:protein-L-isoaspartate(D-aspartate) O-methyltransferase